MHITDGDKSPTGRLRPTDGFQEEKNERKTRKMTQGETKIQNTHQRKKKPGNSVRCKVR